MTLRRVQVGNLALLEPVQRIISRDSGGELQAGPLCLTCGRVVQQENIVHETRTTAQVLFRCHGEEELRTYDFDTETWPENATDPDDRYWQLRSFRMRDRLFDPMRHAGK